MAYSAELPLVAVICSVPLVFEGLRDALSSIARVQFFPAATGTTGLLRWVKPDAVVVDSEDEAEYATAFARELDLPLVLISVRDAEVRFFTRGVWLKATNGDEGATPQTVRNIIAGSLYGRRHA